MSVQSRPSSGFAFQLCVVARGGLWDALSTSQLLSAGSGLWKLRIPPQSQQANSPHLAGLLTVGLCWLSCQTWLPRGHDTAFGHPLTTTTHFCPTQEACPASICPIYASSRLIAERAGSETQNGNLWPLKQGSVGEGQRTPSDNKCLAVAWLACL